MFCMCWLFFLRWLKNSLDFCLDLSRLAFFSSCKSVIVCKCTYLFANLCNCLQMYVPFLQIYAIVCKSKYLFANLCIYCTFRPPYIIVSSIRDSTLEFLIEKYWFYQFSQLTFKNLNSNLNIYNFDMTIRILV